MALINCTECNKEISDTAKQCPHCGFKNKTTDKRSAVLFILILVMLSSAISYFIFIKGFGIKNNAEHAIKSLLNDPESAIFSEQRIGLTENSKCGEVNAKNKMGGYTGSVPYYYYEKDNTSNYGIVTEPMTDETFRDYYRLINNDSGNNSLEKIYDKCENLIILQKTCGDNYRYKVHELCDALVNRTSNFVELLIKKYRPEE